MTPGEYVQVILQKADDLFLHLEVQICPYLGSLYGISLDHLQFLDNLWQLFFDYPCMDFF